MPPKEKRARLDARKSRRELYYSVGGKHYSHLPEQRRLSSLLTNYPSLRVYKTKISSAVVELTARFNFYLSLAFPQKTVMMDSQSGEWGKKISHYLESVTESLDCRLSNYTISGFIESKRYGPRHNPKQETITKLNRLTLWLEECCRAAGIWKPFKFKYHISEFDKQRGLLKKKKPKPKQVNETNQTKRTTKKVIVSSNPKVQGEPKSGFSYYAALLEFHRKGQGDSG